MITTHTITTENKNFQEVTERLLRATKRESVGRLLTIMQEHGYYRVGCHGHHHYYGGLVRHNLEMLLYMQKHNTQNLPLDSIVIAALLHDLCKINGFPHIRHHGSRSVLIATREAGFKLTAMEYQAVLWHMHGEREKGQLGASFDAVLDNPLWKLLRKADHYSAGHEMTKEELVLALSGKQKKREIDTQIVRVGNAYCQGLAPSHSIKPKVVEDRPKAPKRIRVSVEEILAALQTVDVELDDVKKSQLIDLLQQQKGQNNKGFCANYLEHADPLEIEEHRSQLIDRCQRNKNSAKLAAQYIYKVTTGVFDMFMGTKDMYDWLYKEFAICGSLESFYKGCQLCPKYPNRR